jgi:Arc/MetJ family transcription regulator
MRISLVIDDGLMRDAMKMTGLSVEEAVEEGLRLLIKVNEQQGIRRLKGKIAWQGDLIEMPKRRIRNGP